MDGKKAHGSEKKIKMLIEIFWFCQYDRNIFAFRESE